MNQTLPIFTPSLAPADLLERVFVARGGLLDDIIDRIKAAGTTTTRNHTLLVGPRGAGKTHLVALAYHRAASLRAEGLAVQLAWLLEDPWALTSYRRLLQAVLEHLEPPLDGLTRTVAEEEIEALLAEQARAHGPIVVFIENLDQVLDAIGTMKQQRLRHLAQERTFLFVASTTTLSRDLADQAAPFYGFFTTTRLEPLTLDEAAEMLRNIAAVQGRTELAEYLHTDQAAARLRTVAHLAGGQPRIWALLSQVITKQGLEELVDLLLTRFDDLTPYYQEQLARLSPQQRDIVVTLVDEDHPTSVKELAELTGIDQRSLGKTLVELRERGWVTETVSPLTQLLDRRRTYYELSEPLARLAFQLKASRGGVPIQLIIDFLKSWFDPDDLTDETAVTELTKTYVRHAAAGHRSDPVLAVCRRLHALPASRVPALELLARLDDACASLLEGDAEPLLRMPTAVRLAVETHLPVAPDKRDLAVAAAALRFHVHDQALADFGHVPHPDGEAWLDRATRMLSWLEGFPPALRAVAAWLGRLWRFDKAMEVLAELERLAGPDDDLVSSLRETLADSFEAAGRLSDAIAMAEEVAVGLQGRLGSDDPDVLRAWTRVALMYAAAERITESTQLQERLVKDYERVFGSDTPEAINAWQNLAIAYVRSGHVAEATVVEERVVEVRRRLFGSDHVSTLTAAMNLAGSYAAAKRFSEAVALAEEVSTKLCDLLGPDDPRTLTARSNVAQAYWAFDRVDDSVELEEQLAADYERLLGPDHPDTLDAWENVAISRLLCDRPAEALEIQERVVRNLERALGADHPATLSASLMLADCYGIVGRLDECVSLLERVVADTRAVLGPTHRQTAEAMQSLGMAYQAMGRSAEAIACGETAVTILESYVYARKGALANALETLASAYRSEGREADAAAVEERLAELA